MTRTRNKKRKPRSIKYKYKEENAIKAEAACTFGATKSGLAEMFKCTTAVIDRWRKENDLFNIAISNGQDAFNCDQVEDALRKRALGFEYDEVHEEYIELDGEKYIEVKVNEKVKVKNNKTGKTTTKFQKVDKLVIGKRMKIVHKLVIPDVGADRYYLNNRKPDRWNETKAIEVTGKGGTPLTTLTGEMSEEQALRIYNESLKDA